MSEARDSSPSDGGRASRIILVDAAFDDARAGHHWRLNKGYADLLGWDRTWIAAARSLGPAPGVPGDRLIGAFGASHYDAGERERHGRLGQFLQAIAYRDDTGAPAWFRRQLQRVLAARRRAGPSAPPRRAATSPSLYADDLSALVDREGLGPQDHLIFSSLDPEMGRAILDLIVHRGAETLPAMHLRLMYDDATGTASPLDYEGLIDRLIASGEVGGRLRLYAETARHADGLSSRTGLEVGVAPFPAAPLPPPPPPDGRRLVIGYLGEARIEKGFDRLEAIMDAFAARHPGLVERVAWRIHAGGRTIEASRQRDHVRLSARSETMQVERTLGALEPAAYEALRAGIDIVLAPQDPAVYGERGSGIAQEAVAGGRPLVCLNGSSLAAEDGVVLAGVSDEDLADALARIVVEARPFFDRAQARAEAFEKRLTDSGLVRTCAKPLAVGPDRGIALIIDAGQAEAGAHAQALTELGYQVARMHLVPPGQTSEAVLTRAMRGPQRDRNAMLSLVAAGDDDGGPALEAFYGRVGLIVAVDEPSVRWAERQSLNPSIPRVLVTPSAGESPHGFHRAAFSEAEMDLDTQRQKPLMLAWRSVLAGLAGDASRPRANRV